MEEALKQQKSSCLKVVVYGPESTGKTTLSKQLAASYNTDWVPEYAREYLQKKWDSVQKICESEDLLPIAKGQMALENSMARNVDKILICDTDLLETMVYSEVYYNGFVDPIIKKYAVENSYDLYFLTYIDVPWEADDLRDKPNERSQMFNAFKEALEKANKPFVVLKGNKEQRLALAKKHINHLLKSKNEI